MASIPTHIAEVLGGGLIGGLLGFGKSALTYDNQREKKPYYQNTEILGFANDALKSTIKGTLTGVGLAAGFKGIQYGSKRALIHGLDEEVKMWDSVLKKNKQHKNLQPFYASQKGRLPDLFDEDLLGDIENLKDMVLGSRAFYEESSIKSIGELWNIGKQYGDSVIRGKETTKSQLKSKINLMKRTRLEYTRDTALTALVRNEGYVKNGTLVDRGMMNSRFEGNIFSKSEYKTSNKFKKTKEYITKKTRENRTLTDDEIKIITENYLVNNPRTREAQGILNWRSRIKTTEEALVKKNESYAEMFNKASEPGGHRQLIELASMAHEAPQNLVKMAGMELGALIPNTLKHHYKELYRVGSGSEPVISKTQANSMLRNPYNKISKATTKIGFGAIFGTTALAGGSIMGLHMSAQSGDPGHPYNAYNKMADRAIMSQAQMEADMASKARISNPKFIGLNDSETFYHENPAFKPKMGLHRPGQYNDDGDLVFALSALRH